jgi:potassium/hydrogen antiporter
MHSETVLLAQHYLTAFLIIFVLGTIAGKIAQRFGLPEVALYFIVGMIFGPSVLHMFEIKADSTVNQLILLFGASFIIFHGGTITSLKVLKQVWRSVALLSTTGVLITAFVVAIAASWVFHIPFLIALLLGAILASTDPASLVPIFQRFPVRRKVAQTVISESAFTDATGAIMTTVVLGLVTSNQAVNPFYIGLDFLHLAFGGIIVGAIVGFIAALLISENDRGLLREYTPMVVILTVLSAYLGAEYIEASGFMSVFVAGLIIGNASSFSLTILPEQNHAMHQFIDAIGLKLGMSIFILLESQVNFAVLQQYGLLALVVVAIFMFIARPLTVLTSLLPDRQAKWRREEVAFFFWTRETGVIAAALVGMLASSGIALINLLTAITFVAILVTLVVQTSTTPWVAKKFGLLEKNK